MARNFSLTTFRQTDVLDRTALSSARKSIQSRPATQSSTTFRLAWLRRKRPSRPIDSAQASH